MLFEKTGRIVPQLNSEYSQINGKIAIPPSKSHTQRAIILASLSKGESLIKDYLDTDDSAQLINSCKQLGASIVKQGKDLFIEGTGGHLQQPQGGINVGNSGIALRFLTAIASLLSEKVTISGDSLLKKTRGMQPLIDALGKLGVSIVSDNGYAPVSVKGPLVPGKTELVGQDSQFVSALLIAAAFCEGNTTIDVYDAGELPYLDMTLEWLDRLGVSYTREDYRRFSVKGGKTRRPFTYRVPGDLSSCAFPLAAALVTRSSLEISNVNLNDSQGDRHLIDVFKKMGAEISYDQERDKLYVAAGAELTGAAFDINAIIDAIPILSVVACFAKGTTHLYNAEIARHKECDRLSCTADALRQMGALIKEEAGGLVIEGSKLCGSSLSSYGDHRMALALAVAGLGAKGKTSIKNAECCKKTYPDFVNDMQALGAKITWNM